MAAGRTRPNTTAEERDRERDRFVWLFNNCQNRVGLYNAPPDADSKHLWFEEEPDRPTRDLCADDVKVTVKYSKRNNHLAHLGTIEGTDAFTLGIHFERWRRQPPEQKLITLGHELAHARYSGHEAYYWEFTFQIWEEILAQQDYITEWFTGAEMPESRPAYLTDPVDWDYFRNRAVDDVYDNAETASRDELVERAASRFEYPYEHIRRLDWGRKYGGHGLNADTSEWAGEVERVPVTDVVFSTRESDASLADLHESLDAAVGGHRGTPLPEIRGRYGAEGGVHIVENESYAALLVRTSRSGATLPVVIE